MVARAASTTRAKVSDIDIAGARPQQRPGAGVHRGAGGQHVVDENDPPACHQGFPGRRHLEGALNINGPLGLRQADLLGGRLDPLERVEDRPEPR